MSDDTVLVSVKEAHAQVRRALFDETNRYWSNQEILDGLNDARRVLFSMKPRVYEATEDVPLAAGTRQTLPHDSTVLFRAIANVSASSQRAITPIRLELLNRVRPRWRTEGARQEIVHFMYEENAPTEYEVYPPAKPGTVIRISFAKPPVELKPTDLDGSTLLLTKERAQAGALIDYAVHRCLLKEADSSPPAAARSQHYLQLAIQKIDGESSGRAKSDPNVTHVGGPAPKVHQ